MPAPGERARIAFADISSKVVCRGFQCRSRDITAWFAKRALKEHEAGRARVTCAVDADRPHRPLGFYALATVAEEVRALQGRYQPFRSNDHFSALHLTFLATDKGFEDRGIGTRMVARAIRTFAEVAPRIGLPHLIVIPDPADIERLTDFYSKLGFAPYRGGEAMFLSQQAAVEAIEHERATLAAEAVPEPANEAVGDTTPLVQENPAPDGD